MLHYNIFFFIISCTSELEEREEVTVIQKEKIAKSSISVNNNTSMIVEIPLREKLSYTSEDLKWLSHIIHAESRGEDRKGKILAAEVVLNRVKSEHFPDTVKEVVFQGNGIQFEPVINGTLYLEASEESKDVAEGVLTEGIRYITPDILYFHATTLGKQEVGTKWWGTVETAFVHKGHVFGRDIRVTSRGGSRDE